MILHLRELLTGDDGARLVADPDLACDGGGREWVIAADDDDPNPCAVTAGDRVRHLWSGWIAHGDQSEEAEALFRVVSLHRRRASRLELSRREAEDSKPA